MSLAGKVVIVTGASSGIGAKTAEEFAKIGSKVVLVARSEANLKITEATCRAANKNAELLLIVADVTVDGERIINTTIDKFGQLDVLVNNAGASRRGGILETSVEDFDWNLDINLRSVFILSKLAAPHLIKTQGNIVNVSSITGARAFPNIDGYCVSKAGLDHLTRCIAMDLADKHVRVNVVSPGVIVTDLHLRAGMPVDDYYKYLESAKKTHALGRVGETKEVSDAIIYLASDAASFITGANVPVDGGKHAMCPQ